MKLSKLVLAMCLATGVMSTAVAQVVMRNAISVAQNSHAGEAVDTLAREVEKRTNGRIVIKNFYSGSLGGEREVMESVQLGTQELGHNSTGPVLTSCQKLASWMYLSCFATRRMHALF